ncbi:hypothetical protein HY17_14215 [Hyphomonas sp. CY54-11-8]|jgi:hypothetical protein|nr:hypothetical protein HY17_14215 [Hyphomonas sp. CY54-11-8]RAN41874.1 hypothetical protein HY26_07380 [Hyphomonas sp. GM-8P]
MALYLGAEGWRAPVLFCYLVLYFMHIEDQFSANPAQVSL